MYYVRPRDGTPNFITRVIRGTICLLYVRYPADLSVFFRYVYYRTSCLLSVFANVSPTVLGTSVPFPSVQPVLVESLL